MLKSDLLKSINSKHSHLNPNDIELIANLFFKKIIKGLQNNQSIEIRGFGTFTKKRNKAKQVPNPKTNEKIFKDETFKIHFKIGKVLHGKINSNT